MDTKKEFTKIIAEQAKLAKAHPESLSTEKVVKAAGAIALTESGEHGFDLRPIEDKGILPPDHPVRVAAKLNPNPNANINSFLELVKRESAYPFAKLALGQTKERSRIYSDPNHLYPINEETEDSYFIPLEAGVGIALGKSEKALEKFKTAPKDDFFSSYLEFAQHILVNNGLGRIADIEKRIKANAENSWSVSGTHIFIPGRFEKKRFHQNGLLVVDNNFSQEGVQVSVPISVFDLQIDVIVTKLKAATK